MSAENSEQVFLHALQYSHLLQAQKGENLTALDLQWWGSQFLHLWHHTVGNHGTTLWYHHAVFECVHLTNYCV